MKSFLNATIYYNGDRIIDNVVNPLWVIASWKSDLNLIYILKSKTINFIILLGFRDWVPKELQRVGCVELLNTVQRRVRPKLHVFGGIHEGNPWNKMPCDKKIFESFFWVFYVRKEVIF